MTPDRYQRVCELFHAVCELPDSGRSEFLNREANGDAHLIAQVEALLAHDDDEDHLNGVRVGFAQHLIDDDAMPTEDERAEDSLPESIGAYQIVRKLGEGGMGIVYEATQSHPERRVALKIMRPGFSSSQALRRFRNEVEVQGRLNHPGIGHVYEAGIERTPHGDQPYFAMELIEGQPITEFALERRLSVNDRLRLMVDVCDAVQHAHDHGIVHRDLKPGNIVVDPVRGARVLDFGIARATESDLQLTTVQTLVGQLMGTVPYMSPEQITGRNSRLDERTDVYALGVILYELLAQRRPYDLSNCSIPQAAMIIQDEDPKRLGSIYSELRGEIESIVAKAMDKDPQRRYVSAGALADDLRHVLSDEPVSAKPPGTWYQLRRFAHRNKVFVVGIVATGLSLVAGLIGTATFAYRESRQRVLAEKAQDEAQRQTYRVSVAAAASALENQNVLAARQLLLNAPPPYRNWEWYYLNARIDTSERTLRTDVRSIDGIQYSDDGKTLIGHYAQSYIRWNLATGVPIDDFPGTQNCPAAASDDFRVFAYPETGGGVRVVDTSNASSTSLANCPSTLDALAIDRKGRLIAFSAQSAELQIRRIRDGEVLFSDQLRQRSRALAWSPLGSQLAIRSTEELIIVDARSAAVIQRFVVPHTEKPGILSWAPDGHTILLADHGNNDSGAILRFDISAARELSQLTGHARTPYSFEFVDAGRRLLSSAPDGDVRLWDLQTGTCALYCKVNIGTASSAGLSPDSSVIAAGDSIGSVHLFDARSGHPLITLHGHESPVQSIAFSPDGQFIAAGASDGSIRFWPTSLIDRSDVLTGHKSYVYPVTFSPDGETLASAAWDGTVRLWNMQSGKPIRKINGHDDPPYFLAFSRSGSKLVSYGHRNRQDNEVIVDDLASGRQYRIQGERQRPCMAPAFHKDGNLVWLPRTPGPTARFWRFESGAIETHPVGSLRDVDSPLISPDLKSFLLISGDEQTLSVVSVSTGKVVHRIIDQATHARWSPDGKRFVVISRSSRDLQDADQIGVWDVASGARIGNLIGHVGGVFDARYSPDGSRIMTCGRDESIRIWDADSFLPVIALIGHTEYVWSIAFDPTGRRLASGSGDGTIRIWESPLTRESR